MEIGIILAVGGAFILAAVGLRWKYFMNHYKVRWVTKVLGRAGAMVFYVVCGLLSLIVGMLMILGIID